MDLTTAARRSLKRVLAFGVDNLLDDSIKPREIPISRRNNKNNRWARIDEPDTRILEPHEWPQNTVTHLDKMMRVAHDMSIIKPLLIKNVRARQSKVGRYRSQMVREVHGCDLSNTLEDIYAENIRADNVAAGKKRKERADTPLQGHVDEEVEPPAKRHQPQSRPTLLHVKQEVASPKVKASPGPFKPMTKIRIQFGDIPQHDEDSALSTNVELPAGPSSVTLRASASISSLGNNVLTANPRADDWVNPLHSLLESYVKRLEEIKQTMDPNKNKESEQAAFAAHAIASSKLGYSTHDLDVSSSQAFFDVHSMLLDDERTHLDHLRAVLEENVLKLSVHIKEHPTLRLSQDLDERIAAVLE